METSTPAQPHISDYTRPLWSRKWLVLMVVAIATGGVYGYYASQPKVYSSTTLVYVKDPGDPISGTPSLQSTDRNVSNQASLLYSRATAASVARKIDYDGTPGGLLRRVSITSRQGQDFVNLTARGRSPQESATISNAYAKEFVTLVNDSQKNRVARALQLSRKQLRDLPGGPATEASRQSLGEQIRRLELAQEVPQTITRQVDPAEPPRSPSEPKPVRNALFAFVLSVLLAIGLAFGLERFDRRLKRPEQVEEAYGAQLLAVLPHSWTPAPMTHHDAALSPEFEEAFRSLRTNIKLARLDRPPRTIVVTSATAGEGKSTVVRNLALAFREIGSRVAVVEADLRHPTLAELFGVEPGPGLTDVLRHERTIEDVALKVGAAMPDFEELVRVDAERSVPRTGTNGAAANGSGNGHGAITLLLSGRRPANPPAVLASERTTHVLDELRETHDIVLLDSAPLLPVTDTVALLRYADAAIVVGRLGVTSRDTAKRLAEFLGRIPDVDLLGIVANDLSKFEAAGYGYGYGYGYGDEHTKKSGRAKRLHRVKLPA